MRAHLTDKQQVDVVEAFTIQLEPAITIAGKYGVTRQGIYKMLKRHGVDPQDYGMIPVTCQACGKEILRNRAKLRRQKRIFCGRDCYYAWLEAHQDGSYNYNRNGMRIAREVVTRYYQLQPSNIVHHINRDTLDNNPRNLMVFANSGDHTRWHRGQPENIFGIVPLWDGSKEV